MREKFQAWIRDHIPTFCSLCLKVAFRKDMQYVRHQVAGVVPVCPSCYRKLYHPFDY